MGKNDNPAPPPSLHQGGFTYVTVMMGVLMGATGLLVLVLCTWVRHDGGLPEGGTATRMHSTVSGLVAPRLTAADDVLVRSKGPARVATTNAKNSDVC